MSTISSTRFWGARQSRYGVYDIAANGRLCMSVSATTRLSSWSPDPPLAGYDGPRTLSGHDPVDDHGGWRRFEWVAGASVQNRTSEAGSGNWPDDRGLPITRRERSKWEQNRAPAVLPHHADLARKTAGQPKPWSNWIASTTTRSGLVVRCELDTCDYSEANQESATRKWARSMNSRGMRFHPKWNYTISPKPIIMTLLFLGVAFSCYFVPEVIR